MVDFRLNGEGDLELQAIGEALHEQHIWEKTFPLLAEARRFGGRRRADKCG